MSHEKDTSGYGERISAALHHGPEPMSVRALAREVGARYPDLRGTSYGGIRQYAEGNVDRPRVELLRAIAEVLGVRPEWLAFDEGAMTEHQQEARWMTREASRVMTVRLRKTVDVVNKEVLEALERQPDPDPAAWVPPLVRVLELMGASILLGTRSIEDDGIVRHEAFGPALRGPLDALEVDPSLMPRETLDDYVMAMLPALNILAREKRRQRESPTPYDEEGE